jgi:Acid phosphatase (class B)
MTEGDTKYLTDIRTCSSTYHIENLNLVKYMGDRKRDYVYVKTHTHI